ncbi:hypothetical protein WN55_02480 [Dufourea novaeangliae]|uniref:Uncharacterized protein n=1 Tax=Dufourea novaeangliae TaxID=178035 RepID=A0A154PGY4_DUFNO|nr:hypothetical protein WN55_02480 [Dufourea novaeangliae]
MMVASLSDKVTLESKLPQLTVRKIINALKFSRYTNIKDTYLEFHLREKYP